MKHRKFLSIVLMLALSLSFADCSPINAAKKMQLNKKKLSLSVGETYTLKVKNCKKKVKWSSSKPIVNVSKKGKVTAKKVGKAKVTAKVGKNKYICNVTVKPKKDVKPTPTPITPSPTGNVNNVSQTSTPSNLPSTTPDANKKTLIYNLENETNVPRDENGNISITCSYDDSYILWKCPAIFCDHKSIDYRGKKLYVEMNIKNTGKRALPELMIGFNQTFPHAYPLGYYLYDTEATLINFPQPEAPDYDNCVKLAEELGYYSADALYEQLYEYYLQDLENYNAKLCNATIVQHKILPGEDYFISFEYTLLENAINRDRDFLTGDNYPLQMQIFTKCTDTSPYQQGDEITISGCRIYVESE